MVVMILLWDKGVYLYILVDCVEVLKVFLSVWDKICFISGWYLL